MTAKRPKRPRDAAQLAKRIVDIAGAVEDREPTPEEEGKNPHARFGYRLPWLLA